MTIVGEEGKREQQPTGNKEPNWAQVYNDAEDARRKSEELKATVAEHAGKAFVEKSWVTVFDTAGVAHELNVREYVSWLGLQADRLSGISYGGEVPPRTERPETPSAVSRNLPA